MLNLKMVPSPNPKVVGSVVDGEAVLVLPDQGKVKVLNEVGARMWSLVDGVRSLEQIARQICAEYSVDLAQAEMDTLEFIAQLEQRGVVQFPTAL